MSIGRAVLFRQIVLWPIYAIETISAGSAPFWVNLIPAEGTSPRCKRKCAGSRSTLSWRIAIETRLLIAYGLIALMAASALFLIVRYRVRRQRQRDYWKYDRRCE